ncbi:MAG: aminodeoxychorismate/anthranilate synthase component II [Parvularculaceae bacterium]|nr:aminodeoxychorismate/anthranilate synthase component II [Parvularculaceae bacterium]
MILIVDNYDSFVHNLARYVREASFQTLVVRNDTASADEILRLEPAAVIISPGPKAPVQAGVSLELVRRLPREVPLLGVCLGHQCLIEAFGGRTVRSVEPLHGEASDIHHDGRGIFAGIESPLRAGRYHSLVGELAEDGPLDVSARSASGEIMAVRHRTAPWNGVQFHPESLLTPEGRKLIGNFLREIKKQAAA